jgi:hypothetical protein
MPITLSRANLLSRSVRQSVSGSGLTRKLNLSGKLQSNQNDGSGGSGGFLQNFFNTAMSWGRRFIGFLSNIFRGIGFTFGAIFGAVVRASQAISTFDWNASDKEIQAQINARNVALAGTWGATLGSGTGWLVGIGIGYGFTIVCPVIGSARLAKLVAGEATLEALEEVGSTAINAVRQTAATLGTNALLSGYRRFRRALGINPPDSAPSWTIAGKIEEKIDSIKSPTVKAFVEEFTDEFFDSFIEAGYIFAYELDSQLAAARAANAGGVSRAVRITPDKEAPGEAIVLVGAQDTIKSTVQTTLAQHKLIYNRDVGMIVGEPAADSLKARPHQRKLSIVFKGVERPPLRLQNGDQAQSVTLTIPDPKPGLSWNQIKRAAKPYNWGPYRCTAQLTNGRQIAVYGASALEAEEKLRDLLDLSTCEISTLGITQQKDRNPRLKKNATRVYPYAASLLVRRDSVDPDKGRTIGDKTMAEKIIRFELWTQNEPRSFKEVIW